MLQYFSISFLYSLAKDAYKAWRGSLRKLTNSQRLELRHKWKPQFEEAIYARHQKGLRKDIVIRDVNRMDSYPETDDSQKGISPWFRVGLLDTYHRGILVGLSYGSLTMHNDGKNWRFTDYLGGEKGDLDVSLLARIPYENIDSVDWEGDEYYGGPHIYCFFAHDKTPYEFMGFFTETGPLPPNGRPLYHEITSFQQVKKFSKRFNAKYFS